MSHNKRHGVGMGWGRRGKGGITAFTTHMACLWGRKVGGGEKVVGHR